MTMLPWNVEDLTFDETRFSGATRLFPLPDLVMYPHVMQPLHIFESRYREMLNEALDSDGLITMCVLDPGWEGDYESRPAILPYGCLGKIVTHHRLDDGTYNLMLLGMRRVRILKELSPQRAFREAEVELLDDVYPVRGEAKRAYCQERLMAAFQQALPADVAPNDAIAELLSSQAPLAVLTDLVSFALPLAPELKRRLLGECNVDRRAQILLKTLGANLSAAPSKAPRFRPPFSLN